MKQWVIDNIELIFAVTIVVMCVGAVILMESGEAPATEPDFVHQYMDDRDNCVISTILAETYAKLEDDAVLNRGEFYTIHLEANRLCNERMNDEFDQNRP